MERVDDYKHRYEYFSEVAQVKRGEAYSVGDGWKVTTMPRTPPYHRARQKRQDAGIIQKELQEGESEKKCNPKVVRKMTSTVMQSKMNVKGSQPNCVIHMSSER